MRRTGHRPAGEGDAIGTIWFDIRCALRTLRRSPGFTGTVVIALAIGVALPATLMTLLRVTILQRPPYADANQVITILAAENESCAEDCPDLFTWPTFRAVENAGRGLTAIAPFSSTRVRTDVADSTAELAAVATSSRLFEVLGAPPTIGRPLLRDDDEPGAPPIVVLGFGAWRRHFQGAREVVGRQLLLDGESHTVVGVMPAGFDYPRGTDLWTNLRSKGAGYGDAVAAFTAVARLDVGTTIQGFRSQLQVLARQLQSAELLRADRRGFAVRSILDEDRSASRSSLWLFATVTGFVLFLACVNIQILILARSLARGPEMGVRAAIGGSRWRIARQLAAEHVAIGLLAGLFAALLASLGLATATSVLYSRFGISTPISFDVAAFATALGLAVVLSLAAGLSAQLHLGRLNVAAVLKKGTAAVTTSRGHKRLRLALVGLEAITALLLLCAAGVLFKSFLFVQRIELGFDDRTQIARIDVDAAKRWDAEKVRGIADRIVAQLSDLPGVTAATAWSTLGPSMMVKPGEPFVTIETNQRELRPCSSSYATCPWPSSFQGVDSSFFVALRIPIVRGRGFNAGDRIGTEAVAIVNERAAELWWPGGEPIGKRFKIGPASSGNPWLSVVGVAMNTHPVSEVGSDWGARFAGRHFAMIFVPLSQMPLLGPGRPEWAALLLVAVRPQAPGAVPAPLVGREIRASAPEVQIGRVTDFRSLLNDDWSIGHMRAYLLVIGSIALVGVALAILGLVAIITHSVRSRSREIGIRMALGAPSRAVLHLVSREAVAVALVGVLVASALLVLFRPLWSRLFFGGRGKWPGFIFGTDLLDPGVIGLALAIFVGTVVVASWLPARAACRVDAAISLRSE